MADNTSTTIDGALKQLYDRGTVENLVYKNQPMLGLLDKDEQAGGRNIPIVIQYANTQGRSATFANAQSNTTAEKIDDFLLTYKTDYAVASITGLAADQSKGDAKSFLDGISIMVDGAFHSVARSIGVSLFRDGTGWRGQVGSLSTTSLTLKHSSQVTNFEVGMTLVFSDDQATLLDSADTDVVTAVNRSTGVLTSANTWSTKISGLDADDYIYVEGDHPGSAVTSTTGLVLSGLNAWVPTSAPTSTAFYGVDRSVDSRLGGQRYDGSAQLVEEALIDGQSTCAVEGGMVDTIFLNHVKARELVKAQGSKTTFERGNRKAKGANGDIAAIGFSTVVLDGDYGPIDVISDINCEYNVAWGLQMDTWKLYSIGQAPKLLALDDNKILRQSSLDGYEVRVGGYLNLGCSAPGYNVRIALAS